MPKPPETTPHSDLDGVDEDERRNVDAAIEAGQDAEDLAEARRESRARPPLSEDETKRGTRK